MAQTPAHDWMLPKLVELLAAAEQAGIAREVAVAVLTDLIDDPEITKTPAVPDRV